MADAAPAMAARLEILIRFLRSCADTVAKEEKDTYLGAKEFRDNRPKILQIVKETKMDNWRSWRKVQGRLGRLLRLNIFDSSAAARLARMGTPFAVIFRCSFSTSA